MKKATFLALMLALVAGLAQAAERTIVIAAEEPGGSWYAYSATFSKIIEENTPYKVEIIPRGGGIANPSVLDRARADFAFSTSNASVWARDGLEVVYRGNKHANVRSVFGALQNAYEMVLARRDYVERSGLTTIPEMLKSANPPIMLTEPTGSQDPIIVDFMMKGLGTSLDAERRRGTIVQISSSQMGDYINDNKAQVFIANGPSGHSTTTEVAMSVDMVPIAPTEDMIKTLNAAGMPTGTLPAGIYRGQDKEYRTNVSSNVFLTHKDVEEEVVYNVIKALCENVELLHREHPPLRTWTPQLGASAEQNMLEIHPGAMKYYKEMGWR